MLRNSLGHRGGVQAPQIPEGSSWLCSRRHVGGFGRNGGPLEMFALAQSNLSSPGAKAVAAVEITARTLV